MQGGDGNWGLFSFNPSADIYSLRIADTSASFGELDNITITTVPEVGPQGLLAVGAMGLIVALRRRQSRR
jgi:MYXO-CTERM domain-containing protein